MNQYRVRFDFEDRTTISIHIVAPTPVEAIRTMQLRLDASGWELAEISSVSVELLRKNIEI